MVLNTLIDFFKYCVEDPKETNSGYKLRNIILADSTGRVAVTLWDTKATDFNANEGDIMSIKGGKIIDYENLKKITVTGSSKVEINPCWNETLGLQIWYKEFEENNLLNLSQVSVGSQELHMFEISQSFRNKTEYERILQQMKIDEDLISKRLLELNDEQHKIETERADLHFKTQRLLIERESTQSRLEN